MLLSQSNYCDMKTEDVHCWWEDTLGVIRSCFSYSVAFDSAERKVHLLPWQPIQSMCFEWVWSPDWQRSGRSLKISMPVSSYGPSADDIFFPVFFFFFFNLRQPASKCFTLTKALPITWIIQHVQWLRKCQVPWIYTHTQIYPSQTPH